MKTKNPRSKTTVKAEKTSPLPRLSHLCLLTDDLGMVAKSVLWEESDELVSVHLHLLAQTIAQWQKQLK